MATLGTAKQPSAKPKSISGTPKQPTNKPNSFDWDNIGAIGISAIGQGIAGGIDALTKRNSYNTQALLYSAQAETFDTNARLADLSIANAYQSGAYESMVQGLADAQKISQTRVSTASRGVLLNSGSAGEIEASQRINAKINQINIQRNTTSAINQARMQKANNQAQAIIQRGNAEASRILANATNPLLSGVMSFASALFSYDASWQMQGNESIFSSVWKGIKSWQS